KRVLKGNERDLFIDLSYLVWVHETVAYDLVEPVRDHELLKLALSFEVSRDTDRNGQYPRQLIVYAIVTVDPSYLLYQIYLLGGVVSPEGRRCHYPSPVAAFDAELQAGKNPLYLPVR